MELKIDQKNEEPLLSRTRVECTLSFQNATPSNTDVTKQIAEALKADENAVAVRHIYTAFGKKSAKVLAYAYKDETSKRKVEPKPKQKEKAEKKTETPKQETSNKEGD